eukprot:TRINITY_DN4506_c0_g2_i1.p1 TRINITY_DN4506_c0_g2~~TRINITY_DN4506_c0_g2_i1.p1  ORF type:complete len:824 (+),score=155.57 TRINITY_DN4506_c0_g2_i1:72-2543(+)
MEISDLLLRKQASGYDLWDFNNVWSHDSSDDEEYLPSEDILEILPNKDSPSTISNRTRARVSLINVALEDLERNLPEIPIEGSKQSDFEEDEAVLEYKKFLEILLQGGNDLAMDLDDDENDADFILEDMQDFDNCTPLDSEYDVQHGTKKRKRRNTTTNDEIDENMDSNSPAPILPYMPNPMAYLHNLVTHDQRTQIHTQLSEHFQLLIQVLLLALQDEEEVAQVDPTWKILIELQKQKDQINSRLGNKSPDISMDVNSTHANNENDIVNDTLSDDRNGKVGEKVKYTGTAKDNIYEVPGIDLLDKFCSMVNESPNPSAIAPEALKLFGPTFSTYLKIAITSSRNSRLNFTPSEDKLLALGLERHGTKGFELIQQKLLPTKTTKQLINRYKNRTCSRAAWNPLKAYKQASTLARTAPLNEVEIALLEKGIAMYGYNWDMISLQFLPHRRGSVLSRLWRTLQKQTRKKTSKGSDEAANENTESDERVAGPVNALFADLPNRQYSPVNNPVHAGDVRNNGRKARTDERDSSMGAQGRQSVKKIEPNSNTTSTATNFIQSLGLERKAMPRSATISPSSILNSINSMNKLQGTINSSNEALTPPSHRGNVRGTNDTEPSQKPPEGEVYTNRRTADTKANSTYERGGTDLQSHAMDFSQHWNDSTPESKDMQRYGPTRTTPTNTDTPNTTSTRQTGAEVRSDVLGFEKEVIGDSEEEDILESVASPLREEQVFETVELDDSDSGEDDTTNSITENPILSLTPTFGAESTVWTQEEDKKLLLAAKRGGAVASTWQGLIEDGELQHKTIQQADERYMQLVYFFLERDKSK